MRKTLMMLIFIVMMVGCVNTNVCPPFPKPTNEVLKSIHTLQSKEVDSWMIELFKLNEKIKECRNY